MFCKKICKKTLSLLLYIIIVKFISAFSCGGIRFAALCIKYKELLSCFWRSSPQWAMVSSLTRFLDHTQRCTAVGRAPLDERSACHRDLYLTTHNKHNRETSMTPVGFKPIISAGERPQTHALDSAATGTNKKLLGTNYNARMSGRRRIIIATTGEVFQQELYDY